MRGPCAKRRVYCVIMTRDFRAFDGENDCANPQSVCPRAPGEGYEKCRSICQQAGHAEMVALARAKEAGADLKNALVTLEGHYWICEPCGRALLEAGVSDIRIIVPRAA